MLNFCTIAKTVQLLNVHISHCCGLRLWPVTLVGELQFILSGPQLICYGVSQLLFSMVIRNDKIVVL